MNEVNQVPRRCRMDLMNPAELAILNAMREVENMTADVRLTNAVNFLQKAKDSVADFLDDVPLK